MNLREKEKKQMQAIRAALPQRFLWIAVLTIVTFFSSSAYAVNTANCEIDNRFGVTERRILTQACQLAVERMQSREVRDKVYQLSGFSYLSDSVISRSHATATRESRWNLLWRQLSTLSSPNGDSDTEPPFPNIYILYASDAPRSGQLGWLGRAYLDLVTVYWDSSEKEWKQKGSFVITINDYFVARGQRYSDPNDWAGTIAHEMLHNLGHRHPDSTDPDYNKYQINVLDVLVQNYGSDFKGMRWSQVSDHSCEQLENPSVETGQPLRFTINGRTITIR